MPHFMARALALLPQPAALFETPGHAFVAANQSARVVAQALLPPDIPHDHDMVAKYLDLAEPLAAAEEMDEKTLHYRADFGIIYISRIPAQARHPRPDLLLMTMHANMDEADAWLDHNRMILALKINENSEIALRVLESSLTQISAAMQTQADLVHSFNASMGDWVRNVEPSRKTLVRGY